MDPSREQLPLEPNGKSILVLGATGVLGGEVARRLHALGARLTLTGRAPGRLVELCDALPGSAALVGDLRDSSTAQRLVDAAVAHGGGLAAVVCASGVTSFGRLADASPVAMEELFLANVLGPLWVFRQAIAPVSDAKGVLCAITGVVAEEPMAGMASYSASKAALSAACVALARELRLAGVTVVDARPGHTETGLAQRPLEGTAPRLPVGMVPGHVAERVVAAMLNRESVLPSTAF